MPPDERGAGVGIAILDALEGWAAEHDCTELEGPVSEDDEGSLVWAAHHGYHEIGRNSRLVLDLTTAEIADPAPPEGIEIVTWADRPELAQGLWEVAREATPDIPGEEEGDIGTLDEWLARDMRGASDDPRAVFAALEHGEVVGYAKLSFSEESTERAFHDLTGVRRDPPRPRDRGSAQADADRLGEGERLQLAADLERGSERADPPPQRAVRLRARAGSRDRARRPRRYLAIASSIARLPITRARCERNSALAEVSLGGSVPSAMYAAGSASPATSACSAAVARKRRRAHVRERNPGVVDLVRAVVLAHECRDADRRPVLGAPVVLEIRPAGPVAELGHPDLRQHLLRPHRRVEDAAGRTPPRRRSARHPGR